LTWQDAVVSSKKLEVDDDASSGWIMLSSTSWESSFFAVSSAVLSLVSLE